MGWRCRDVRLFPPEVIVVHGDLTQAFHGGDPVYYRIPESRELVAQYLLLYETSGGEEAEEYVSSDYRHANLELRLRLAPTRQTADLVERAEIGVHRDYVGARFRRKDGLPSACG